MRPDVLLGHSDFVHRLCRSLLADRDAAADVAQETLLEALRRPPVAGAGRGWLAAVARNLARKAKRSMKRAASREMAVARAGRVVSTDVVLEREEQRRLVVESVLALSEPYRTAILLRYFHDLPPRRIARELDVSVETIHTRLRRARQQLRANLGDDPRRRWSVFALPIGWVESLWRSTTRPAVLEASATARLGLVAGTIGVALVSMHWLMSEEGRAMPLGKTVPREVVAPTLAAMPVLVESASQETAVEDHEAAQATNDVFGRVMTSLRTGIDDVVVTLTNEAGEEHREEAFSGWFDLKDVGVGEWTLRAEAPWYWPHEEVLYVGEKDLPPLEILMERIRVGLRFETVKGRHVLNDWFKWEELFPDRPDGPWPFPWPRIGSAQINVVVSPKRLESVPFPLTRFGRDLYWRNERYHQRRFYELGTRFVGTPEVPMPPGCSGVLELESLEPCWVNLTFQDMIIASAHLEEIPKQPEDLVLLTVDPTQLGQQATMVKVQAIDAETGSPIPNVKVGLRCENWYLGGAHPSTDEQGVIQIEQAVPGVHYLSLFHPEYESLEPYAYRVRIPSSGFHDLGQVRLAKRTEVRGVVKNAAGEPVEDAVVWCERLDRRRFPQPLYANWLITTDAEGRFKLEEQGRGQLLIFASVLEEVKEHTKGPWHSEYAIRPVLHDNTETDGPVEIVLQSGPLVTFAVERERLQWPVIEILDSDNVPVWYGELWARYYPDGLRLVAGRYVVRLYDGMELLETRGIEVGADPMTVTFK
ncbi:MAG: sigma-70 family RNA polymerase sigma factor [Planctomycetota bacterium]